MSSALLRLAQLDDNARLAAWIDDYHHVARALAEVLAGEYRRLGTADDWFASVMEHAREDARMHSKICTLVELYRADSPSSLIH